MIAFTQMVDGHPITVLDAENKIVDDDLLSNFDESKRQEIIDYIKDNFLESEKWYCKMDSYQIKHITEENVGYMTENQFKDAMLAAGFKPKFYEKVTWVFKLSYDSPAFVKANHDAYWKKAPDHVKDLRAAVGAAWWHLPYTDKLALEDWTDDFYQTHYTGFYYPITDVVTDFIWTKCENCDEEKLKSVSKMNRNDFFKCLYEALDGSTRAMDEVEPMIYGRDCVEAYRLIWSYYLKPNVEKVNGTKSN